MHRLKVSEIRTNSYIRHDHTERQTNTRTDGKRNRDTGRAEQESAGAGGGGRHLTIIEIRGTQRRTLSRRLKSSRAKSFRAPVLPHEKGALLTTNDTPKRAAR